MLAGLDKPLRLIGAVKTAETHLGGRSLQSHLQMNCVFTRSTRCGGIWPAENIGVL